MNNKHPENASQMKKSIVKPRIFPRVSAEVHPFAIRKEMPLQ